MKSRFIIEFEVDIEKVIWEGDDMTKEVENEVHLAFDRWIHYVFGSPDGMMDDLVDGLNHHIDESCLPDKFELPSFSLSLKDDKQVESEIKKARGKERKKILEWLSIGSVIENGVQTITLTENEFVELRDEGTWGGELIVYRGGKLALEEKPKSGGVAQVHVEQLPKKQKVAGSNPAPANNSAGASLRRFAPKTKYVCRRHGDGCRSYVEGLIDELERTGRKPTEDDLELVIKSSDYKPPKVICEKCSGMLIGFKTCLCAKEGDNKK